MRREVPCAEKINFAKMGAAGVRGVVVAAVLVPAETL